MIKDMENSITQISHLLNDMYDLKEKMDVLIESAGDLRFELIQALTEKEKTRG